ncbi:MAG: permease [Spirochaetes bacterium]|nr:permease [Spirochaetota bacterium]
MKEWKKFIIILSFFVGFFLIPFKNPVISNAVLEAFYMLQEYAREHILLCLVPAFFIAGAIANFISQGAIIKYLGPKANKVLAYGVASVSGSILAVCSCTVLPLFSGIYKKGAGIGPAVAFLYSGPAINVLAIIMTGRILGIDIGIARAVGAIIFSIVIGIIMHLIFIKEDKVNNINNDFVIPDSDKQERTLWKNGLYFFVMVAILIFVNWGKDESIYIWDFIYRYKYIITGIFGILLILMLIFWFKKNELKEWTASSWEFAKQILPLLFAGVLLAGFLLGRPGHTGIIPNEWVNRLVGGNSLFSNFFASIVGAFMYFATLTEVPIVQGLIGSGMGKGPALALLLAGPALSLPNMLVIRSVLGIKKTIVFISLVIIMATFSGMFFGYFYR